MQTITRVDRSAPFMGCAPAAGSAAPATTAPATGDTIARSRGWRDDLHVAGSVSMIAMTPLMLYMAAMPMMKKTAPARTQADRAAAAQNIET